MDRKPTVVVNYIGADGQPGAYQFYSFGHFSSWARLVATNTMFSDGRKKLVSVVGSIR